jgi:hypothetical protein
LDTKFYFKPSRTYEFLQTVCGDEVSRRSSVFTLFKRFKDGPEVLQDDPRSGPPSTSRNADTVANVHETMARDRRRALRMMSDELKTSNETIHQNLHEDVLKRKMCAKFVPTHRLT